MDTKLDKNWAYGARNLLSSAVQNYAFEILLLSSCQIDGNSVLNRTQKPSVIWVLKVLVFQITSKGMIEWTNYFLPHHLHMLFSVGNKFSQLTVNFHCACFEFDTIEEVDKGSILGDDSEFSMEINGFKAFKFQLNKIPNHQNIGKFSSTTKLYRIVFFLSLKQRYLDTNINECKKHKKDTKGNST